MNDSLILGFLVFYPFVGGLLAYLAGRKHEKCRNFIACFVALSELALMLYLVVKYGVSAQHAEEVHAFVECYIPYFCGFGLHFTLDGFRLIYGTIVAFMWAGATLLSGEYFKHHENTNRFYLFLLWTLGATMAVFLSADLYTTFIFFEIMSFTSYVWVAQEENGPSLSAAGTYLAVAVIGGLIMLMGVMTLSHELGTVMISELLTATAAYEGNKIWIYAARFCMFFGFAAKAGAFPLHIWLPKAHPVAPAPASALLSGILTKTGMYGILIVSCNLYLYDVSWSNFVLAIGVLTMFGGAMLAVFSIDLKRTLACSSMSQIGFILVGTGMMGLLGEHGQLAVHGTFLHMMNHSMIKLVLFLAAGVIYMNTHALDLNKIRGFGRKKPLLKVAFLIGALAIGGIPGFGGYISKTLIHESIVEYGAVGIMRFVEYIFLFSGGLTVAYMTKIFKAVFIEQNEDKELQAKYDAKRKYMNPASSIAIAVSAGVLLIWGLFPHQIMDKAAEFAQGFMNFHPHGEGHVVAYFSLVNLKGAIISIVIGALVYVFFISKVLIRKEDGKVTYVNVWPKWFDMENLIYRPVLLTILPTAGAIFCRILDSFVDTVVVLLRKTIYKDSPLPREYEVGNIFTIAVGKMKNAIQSLGNVTWRRKHPVYRDHVQEMAEWKEEFVESQRIIERSLSFGLLMFGIGLCITLFYIIVL